MHRLLVLYPPPTDPQAAALDAAFASPEGEATAADVPNYATGGALLLHYDVREGELPTPDR